MMGTIFRFFMLVRRRMDDAQILAEASSMGSYPIKTAHSALVASLKSSNNVIRIFSNKLLGTATLAEEQMSDVF